MEFNIKITDQLRSFSDYVEVTQKQENGVVVGEYKMGLTEIIRALSNSGSEGLQSETPFLPKNCIKHMSSITGHQVFIDLPKRKWNVSYEGKKLLVGFPRLLIIYYVSKNFVKNVKIFAIKDKGSIHSETEVFFFPYSNVHQESGDVCMGLNEFPEISSLTQLESLHYLFFAAEFGGDYGSMNVPGKSISTLFKDFTDKDFNDDLLIPRQKTIRELLGTEK